MKNILSLIFAALIGGLITLGGIRLMLPQQAVSPTQANLALPVNQINIKAGSKTLPFDFTAAAATARPAVVHISASEGSTVKRGRDQDNPFEFFFGDDLSNPFRGPKQGTGSGVIYTSDGYIITNNHVVEFANELEVTLFDNRKFEAKVIGTDPKTDLAIIKIEANNLSTLRMGDSDKVKVGEWALAVGNPLNLTSTVTAGIISAKGRSIELLGGGDAIEAFLQTDAAVNPGNSGGALVDSQGRLLGINTAIATRTGMFQGYSFAIPVNLVTRIVDDIIEYGSFQRAFLGINISELDSEYATELGVSISQGVVIEKLIDGGSAQYAGLQPKDIIIKVNEHKIKSVPELQEVVGRAKVGETINLTVNRRGKTKNISVLLKAG